MLFRGQDVAHVRGRSLRELRREIQVVFQDPFESLDPRLTVYDTVAESLLIHRIGGTARPGVSWCTTRLSRSACTQRRRSPGATRTSCLAGSGSGW